MTECSVSSVVYFKCARMSKSEYDMLSLHSMFFVVNVSRRLIVLLNFLTKCLLVFDKRLQRIEHKLDSLSKGICEVQEGNEMSTVVSEDNSVLPKSGLPSTVELLSVGDMYIILSAVESKKLYVSLHNVAEPTVDDGQLGIITPDMTLKGEGMRQVF